MRRAGTWLCLALLVDLPCESLVRAADGPPRGKLGEKIADFTLPSAAGRPFALRELQGRKAVVVVFLSFDCPVAAGYAPTLADLSGTYRDVAFVGVSVGDEGPAQVEK